MRLLGCLKPPFLSILDHKHHETLVRHGLSMGTADFGERNGRGDHPAVPRAKHNMCRAHVFEETWHHILFKLQIYFESIAWRRGKKTHYWIRGLKRNATNTSYTSSYPPILETTDSEWNSRTMFCGFSLVPSRAGERCKCANSQTMSNICPCHTLKVESLSYRQMLQKFVRHQT